MSKARTLQVLITVNPAEAWDCKGCVFLQTTKRPNEWAQYFCFLFQENIPESGSSISRLTDCRNSERRVVSEFRRLPK